MNKRLLGFMLISSLAIVSVARAEDSKEGLQLFGAIEYWAPGDVDEEIEKDYDDIIDAVGNGSNEIETSGGVGARFGFRSIVSDGRFDWGGSVGYVQGPEIEATLETFSPAVNSKQTVETNFIRVLLEGAGRIPLGKKVTLRLGAGAGIGRGKVEDEVDVVGVGSVSGSETKTAFTWEVSPAFLIHTGSVDVELGARYSQFPKIKETDDTVEIDWETFGVYAGVAF